MNWKDFILGVISLSLISSAVYAFNTLCDFKIDKDNKNKEHHSKSVSFFGERKISFIITTLIALGLLTGLMINYYFFLSLALLILFNFLYSSRYTRFKEKIILDVLAAGVFAFAIRFIASWFIFSISFPPLLPIIALVSAKTGGYLIYKEIDRPFLTALNIRNSITAIKKRTLIIISVLLWIVSLLSFLLLCLNSGFKIRFLGFLPLKFLILTPLAIPPLIVIYIRAFGKIKTEIKHLRIIGFIYWILAIIIIWKLFL
jgi:4-hydroxybenzoate polyprenyltransferase